MTAQPDEPRTGATRWLRGPAGPREAPFKDRKDAGHRLAGLLERFRDSRPVVVGMARGGVPVAAEVARVLGAPLDVTVVRKIGAPRNPEYALGALAEGGAWVLSEESVRAVGLEEAQLEELLARGAQELGERVSLYRSELEPTDLRGRTAILVDDGLATGRSARAAVQALRNRGAARVVLAVPVAAAESVNAARQWADGVVCAETPEELWAVGYWYEDFSAATDEDVIALLHERNIRKSAG